ncbi:hypothetical protein MUN74_12175 [Agromyces endophyticus]|uniref:hypothetical protein n=1 Tax=Agromyces sp. H17E-10 TaxID=2932244 RepID=UPI001FD24205|nr:hypothetical protein [Agromyces sp. H17E-10]UOQ88049.1 hypothetical protein MUN74_12175 [Agromyces sp. H17E-10]
MDIRDFINWVTAIGGIVVIVGGIFAVFQLWLMTRQGHRQFEHLYSQRYWAIMDRLSVEAQLGTRGPWHRRRSEQEALFAYVQLCEDEADMYEQGRVTRATWTIWKSGIDSMLSSPRVAHIIDSAPPTRFDTLRRYRAEGELRPKYAGIQALIRGL